MWRDPGTWIALGVSALFIVAGVVMLRVFTKILKQGSEDPDKKAANHE
ncbi:cytochrome c biogenesis protein ResB [Acidovorax sp. DW039]|nr:cytochrome c biogenesis protein ResB [Acidovorax sp. DW039]